MTDTIGRMQLGAKKEIGMMPLGAKKKSGKARKTIRKKMRARLERNRDKSRQKLYQQRRRFKQKVERNEKSMELAKEGRERNMNPTAVETIPPRSYAKKIRNPSNLSTLPLKPKYSNAETSRMRIYAKRFDLVDKNPKLLTAEAGAKRKKETKKEEAKTKD